MAKYKWYTTWVWSDKQGDWIALKYRKPWHPRLKTYYTAKVAAHKVKLLKRAGKIATARPTRNGPPTRPPRGKRFKNANAQKWALVRTWLSGDLDAKLELMYAVAKVARDDGQRLYVAEGKRSIREQWRLWTLKLAGKISWPVAYPGRSNHTHGDAMDVREKKEKGTPNIGDSKRRRQLMAKYGLCLPVRGEPWHVEFGNDWRA